MSAVSVYRARASVFVRAAACVCVFVCGLHMLPITSPICVNHHKRRNRVRHSDGDLKGMREEGEPVTGPARHRSQTSFTHTGFSQFGHTLHWLSCARRFQIIPNAFHSLAGSLCQVVNSQRWWFIRRFAQCEKLSSLSELVQDKSFYAGDFFFPSLVCFSAIRVVVCLWNQIPNQPVLSIWVFP